MGAEEPFRLGRIRQGVTTRTYKAMLGGNEGRSSHVWSVLYGFLDSWLLCMHASLSGSDGRHYRRSGLLGALCTVKSTDSSGTFTRYHLEYIIKGNMTKILGRRVFIPPFKVYKPSFLSSPGIT